MVLIDRPDLADCLATHLYTFCSNVDASTAAAVTIASVTLMSVLVISELVAYIKVDTSSHMAVSDFHDHEAVTVRLRATFPFIECIGTLMSTPGHPVVLTRYKALNCT